MRDGNTGSPSPSTSFGHTSFPSFNGCITWRAPSEHMDERRDFPRISEVLGATKCFDAGPMKTNWYWCKILWDGVCRDGSDGCILICSLKDSGGLFICSAVLWRLGSWDERDAAGAPASHRHNLRYRIEEYYCGIDTCFLRQSALINSTSIMTSITARWVRRMVEERLTRDFFR